MTFWKRQNYGDSERSAIDRGAERWGEMARQSTEDLYGSANTLYDIMMDRCHYTFVQTHRVENTNREPKGKLWTLGDYNVSV